MKLYGEDYAELKEYYEYVSDYLNTNGIEVDEDTLNDIVSNYCQELQIDLSDEYGIIKNSELLDIIVAEYTDSKSMQLKYHI